jgi:hypothetical protein
MLKLIIKWKEMSASVSHENGKSEDEIVELEDYRRKMKNQYRNNIITRLRNPILSCQCGVEKTDLYKFLRHEQICYNIDDDIYIDALDTLDDDLNVIQYRPPYSECKHCKKQFFGDYGGKFKLKQHIKVGSCVNKKLLSKFGQLDSDDKQEVLNYIDNLLK